MLIFKDLQKNASFEYFWRKPDTRKKQENPTEIFQYKRVEFLTKAGS